MKRISSIWIAILGIVVGALIVLAYNAYNQKRNMLRVQYGDWRKLNLILDQIDKNYVDTINVGKSPTPPSLPRWQSWIRILSICHLSS